MIVEEWRQKESWWHNNKKQTTKPASQGKPSESKTHAHKTATCRKNFAHPLNLNVNHFVQMVITVPSFVDEFNIFHKLFDIVLHNYSSQSVQLLSICLTRIPRNHTISLEHDKIFAIVLNICDGHFFVLTFLASRCS
jgi:hypothetical protein